MDGFTFAGVHSSAHGMVVLNPASQPVLPDVRMGEWSLGRFPGVVVDPVTFGASAMSFSVLIVGEDAGDLQDKLDDVKAWLNPLNGVGFLAPDWLTFVAPDAGLSRGWYAILNGPMLEVQPMPGRFAVQTQLSWKIVDPAQYGATLKSAATVTAAASGSKTCAASGTLVSLPTVTVTGTAGVTVTLGDGTRTMVLTLPASGVVKADSRIQEVWAGDGSGGWVAGYGCVVAPESGPVAFLALSGAGAAVTWSAGAAVGVVVEWRDRWV